MKHAKYFPRPIAKQREWALNYKKKIAIEGPVLGLSPAEISQEQSWCDAIIQAIDEAESAKVVAKAKNKDKEIAIKTSMTGLRPKIATHKANTVYTESTGKSLGIIGTEMSFDPLTVKTSLKLTNTPSGVSIKFNLKHCEGGNVYCKRGKDEDFIFLKHINHPPMVDNRPNQDDAAAELRQYYVILVLDDIEVGIPSGIATINV